MPVVYLDTVVYSELGARAQGLADAQVKEDEVHALREAMRSGRIIVRPSVAVIDELVSEIAKDRPAMVRKLQLMRGLGNGFLGMLKGPATFARDAFQAYADGAPPPEVLLPEAERRTIVRYLSDVCAGSLRWDHVLTEITGDIRSLKETWRDTMRDAQAQALAQIGWDSRSPEERREMTFERFFRVGAESMADGFAEALGCGDACRRRGLEGLLAVPAVRLCVGVSMSQIYAQVVGEAGQPQVRFAHRGDGYDIWHAILGSTAAVFVTFDQRLAGHLERIPGLAEFRVVRSVTELLAVIA